MNISTINPVRNHAKSILEAQRSTDGLLFQDVLSSDAIQSHIANIPGRDRIFTPDLTLYAFISQVSSADQSCQAAVGQVVAHFAAQGKDISANTAAYCDARSRLPEGTLSALAQESAEQLEEDAPKEWSWRGRSVQLIDGSCVSMPDTPANQAVYPQPDTQKKGVGFPIARIVAVISLATGAVRDLAIGPYSGKGTGEHGLLRQLMDVFKSGDIVLGDCYYASFFLIAMLIKIGVDGIFPIHHARNSDFRRGKRLGKKDHLVKWKKPARPEWMDEETYKNFPDFIEVREVSINNGRPGFRSKSRTLVTTFTKHHEVSKDDLGTLYDCRWFVEINFFAIKQTMRMDILRCKTPEMVRKEIWVHLLAYNLVRKIMAQAAVKYGRIPRQLSFKLALQIIIAFRQAGIFCENDGDIYNKMLRAIAYKKVGNRPGRSEPRMVKRRPKTFPRLQKARSFYHKEAAQHE